MLSLGEAKATMRIWRPYHSHLQHCIKCIMEKRFLALQCRRSHHVFSQAVTDICSWSPCCKTARCLGCCCSSLFCVPQPWWWVSCWILKSIIEGRQLSHVSLLIAILFYQSLSSTCWAAEAMPYLVFCHKSAPKLASAHLWGHAALLAVILLPQRSTFW